MFFRKFKHKIESGGGHNSTCVLFKSTFAGFTIIPFFILMGVFNQWTHLYLKLRSNCRCNCSSPMLTRAKIQTETHCEWPKVPRYPLHQHACSRFPLGIPWRPDSVLNNRLPTLSGKGCARRLLAFYRKFKLDHLTSGGYNLLWSTLRTWNFIFLKRSKGRGGQRRERPGPVLSTLAQSSNLSRWSFQRHCIRSAAISLQGEPGDEARRAPCLQTSPSPVLGSLFFQVFCFRKRVYFSLYVLWIYHNWFWQLLILLNEHIIKILF